MTTAPFLLLSCVAIWGWTFVGSKQCLAYLDPLTLSSLRFLIGLPLLAVLILAKGLPFKFSRKDAPALAFAAGIMTFHFWLQAVALRITTATHAGWIIAVAPLSVVALSSMWLKERVPGRAWIGIALASTGVLVLVSKGALLEFNGAASLGDGMMLLSTFSWAAFTVATRDLSRSRPPLVVTFWIFLPLALIGSFRVLQGDTRLVLQQMPAPAWTNLILLGLLGTGAQWLWQEGVAKVGAAKAGYFLYLEPLSTTLIAVPLLGESFGLSGITGGALVLAGVWWAQRAG